MNLNSGKYLFLEGLKNLTNNKLMSLASVGVLTACLFVVGCSVLLKENVSKIIEFIGEQSTAVIFLKKDSSEQEINELIKELESNEIIKKVDYIDKDKAFSNYFYKLDGYSNNRADDELIKKIVTENDVFSPSLDVKAKDAARIGEIEKIVENFQIVEEINLPTKFSKLVIDLGRTIGLVGIILIVALIIISLAIISNTIRATVFSRRKEIAIMKQVGATNNFIRFPFLIEGMAIGVLSAMIAFVLTWIGTETVILILINNTSAFLNLMFSRLIKFSAIKHWVAISFFICGILTGVSGSLISLRKYLKN